MECTTFFISQDKKSTREFFRTVGSLLLRDAELNLTHDAMTSRVEIFTEDVYMVASTLADTVKSSVNTHVCVCVCVCESVRVRKYVCAYVCTCMCVRRLHYILS